MSKIEDDLKALGERRRAARDELDATSKELTKLVPRARKAGIPKLTIAALGDISRPAIDSILETGQPNTRKI